MLMSSLAITSPAYAGHGSGVEGALLQSGNKYAKESIPVNPMLKASASKELV